MPNSRFEKVARSKAAREGAYALAIAAISDGQEDTHRPFDDEDLQKLSAVLGFVEALKLDWTSRLNAGATIHNDSLAVSDLESVIDLMNVLQKTGCQALLKAGAASCAVSEDTADRKPKPAQPRVPLSLPAVRSLLAMHDPDAGERELAKTFTFAGADDQEKAFLVVCQAVYRRRNAVTAETYAPTETLIYELVHWLSYWPVTLDRLRHVFENAEANFENRAENARLVAEEEEEAEALRETRAANRQRRDEDQEPGRANETGSRSGEANTAGA
jgi:hypothetical protein